MKKLCALPILLLLAILPEAPAVAQFVGIPTTVAQLPTCTAGRNGRIWIVRDGQSMVDCSVGGANPGTIAVCVCSNLTFVPLAAATVEDLAASYVPLSAAEQSIVGTSSVQIGDGSGAVEVSIYPDAVDIQGGTSFDLHMDDNEFEVDLAADNSSFDVAVGGAGSYWQLIADGLNSTGSLQAKTSVGLNVNGGAAEVSVTSASTTISGAFRLTPSTAPPVACSAGTEGTEYFDSDIHKKCVCNGTNYVLANDDSTTTGCS